ncbi:hypothetical protein [Candidatus Nanohalobium constans]|uniref:Uncharacterized protein n=1 Tax=Candidatus Nanohalobium constans TaxID=2565781 RepID=A0A5Q0UGC6_9ARCH|nr:hypothetical protein [Candidatus Nanohalobium constans]QGA80260.1 hypothetical protein LC1Nh_0359 [Candidatus Nanohalobium constans]
MGSSKGQSAVEYLTTYGWMVLVLTVAGSAVFTTVSPGCQVSVQAGPASSLTASESGLEEGNTLSVILRNSESSLIEIRSVKLEGRQESAKNTQIPVGEEKKYEVTSVKPSGECQEYDMTLAYSTQNLPNLEQKFTVRGKFTLPQIIVEKLFVAGDTIEEIETRETVLPTGNNTMCFGDDCGTTEGGELTGSEQYLNISGDSMQGPLNTDALNANCYGDLCSSTQTSDLGYVSSQNNTLNGTLNVTEVKPIQNLCVGGTC